ncbi:MAG: ATP-binding cassette domain-containing protein [Elusimicrobiales bacterium]|nr:ATP-binding cassette domain-containing protein [Elusimicrobiales bacterium]
MKAAPALSARLRHSLPGVELDIDLALGREIGVLFGPSGAGKTMALRLLSGLVRPDEGEVTLNGRALCAPGAWVAPQERRIGFVFQHQALFPHMTVLENVVYGARGLERSRALAEARRLLREFRLEELGDRRPSGISGGQRQRAALARALISGPELLLLDEPFSALDYGTRLHMRDCLIGMIRERNIPVLLVTHDHEEAVALAARLFTVEGGLLRESSGSPELSLGRKKQQRSTT